MPNHSYDEVYLPIAPFRRWVGELKRAQAERMGCVIDPQHPTHKRRTAAVETVVAAHLAMSDRTLRRYMNEDIDVIPFSTVDRAICRHGDVSFVDIYGIQEAEALRFAAGTTKQTKTRFWCLACGAELLQRASLCGFCVEDRELVAC